MEGRVSFKQWLWHFWFDHYHHKGFATLEYRSVLFLFKEARTLRLHQQGSLQQHSRQAACLDSFIYSVSILQNAVYISHLFGV